ncbi:hypothetical protein AAVH_33884, partial [Aphelenchoides avenae]
VQASLTDAISKLDAALKLLSADELASENDYNDLLDDLQSAWRPVTQETHGNNQQPQNAPSGPQRAATGQPDVNAHAGVLLVEEILLNNP